MELFAKKIEKQLASYQQELIETHYREVDNMYRQIRGWRHDYRNHIQTMKAYAAAGDWDAIQNYLDLLDTDLQTVDTVIKTGNPMTDAILNSKISLAKAKGIEVVADAHIPVRLKSSEIDLCCILGNLFDNAIEASMKLPEDKRLIRVYMDMKNTQLYISFTNFTAGKKMQKEGMTLHHSCPGMQLKTFAHKAASETAAPAAQESQLSQWPVQIKLVPVNAPYFDGARLLIAADCTAYAYAAFHERFIKGHITLVGCPKLDSVDYAEKLTEIIRENDIKSVTVVRMEVPCCGGLELAAKKALQQSGKFIPWQVVTVTVDGRLVEE